MAKWDAFFREKKWKNMKKSDWIVLALGGVLLLILAMPVSERKNTAGAGQPRKKGRRARQSMWKMAVTATPM